MKKIIDMHFDTKSYLKSTRNHTAKHAWKSKPWKQRIIFKIFNFLFFYLLKGYYIVL